MSVLLAVDQKAGYRLSIRRYLLLGGALTILLLGGIGGWASTTTIEGAVISSGSLVVASSIKKVQHPSGGVVGNLLVHNGDRVRAGEVLLRLDDTQTRANLAIVSGTLDELTAREARDEAERDGAETVSFPPSLLERAAGDLTVARLMRGEEQLFRIRADSRDGQIAQLQERAKQLDQEITGMLGQIRTKERELAFLRGELEGVRDLYQKNLVQLPRLNALQRDEVKIEGERQMLIASTAQVRGKKAEVALQIIQVAQDLRSEVGKDLAEVRGRISELREKKIAAEDSLRRVDIRAPQSGVVHQLAAHTIGGVVSPSEPIMLIVPDSDQLVAEVKIQPRDVDQVHPGQEAMLRFLSLEARSTPNMTGRVLTISADVSQDQRSGAAFYTVQIGLPPDEMAKLPAGKLMSGMPVEAFLKTGERVVLSYLTKPLVDQIETAWRER